MATARQATKLTMMAMTTTMATGGNEIDNGDGATGYDDYGNDTMATARRATKSTMTMATAR
jgi:hypothetical protein